ncbi:hypothetical protein [Vibrio sp.]|jgi:hypothetical protein|uniref:hypothetical protein n=1 Tax=Vibrio sp. TaxID=678 RepID=UPI00311F586A
MAAHHLNEGLNNFHDLVSEAELLNNITKGSLDSQLGLNSYIHGQTLDKFIELCHKRIRDLRDRYGAAMYAIEAEFNDRGAIHHDIPNT